MKLASIDGPDPMVHFNGERHLGPYPDGMTGRMVVCPRRSLLLNRSINLCNTERYAVTAGRISQISVAGIRIN
jgi:hypothetical protein